MEQVTAIIVSPSQITILIGFMKNIPSIQIERPFLIDENLTGYKYLD